MSFGSQYVVNVEEEFKKDLGNKKKAIKKKKEDKFIKEDGYIFKIEDKWKIVSYLHKSIRHGKVEDARQAAKWIYKLDRNYGRYRLAVIAFEDVAGGNIDLINNIMEQGWKNEEIEKNGGVSWFVDQAGLMAKSIKNRFANDLCLCGMFIDEYLKKYNIRSLEEQLIDDALIIAWNNEENYYFRAIAAWRVVGTKLFLNPKLGKFEGDWELWLESNKKNDVSDNTLRCMEFGLKTQNEGSPIFLGFTEKELNKGFEIKEKKYIDFDKVGPYSSSAIDKHTAEGKKAISLYLNDNKMIMTEANKLFISYEDLSYIVAKIQFRLEGGVLNLSKTFDAEKFIDKYYWNFLSKKMNLNKEIYTMIRNSYFDWHEARKKTVTYKKED